MNKLFIEVVQLQKKANDKAKPDWLQNPPKYLRAAWMEMAEGIDHMNSWKWWKVNKPDYPAAAMEMVDILHFVISDLLVTFNGDVDNTAEVLTNQLAERPDLVIERDNFESFNNAAEACIEEFLKGNIDWDNFYYCIQFTGLNIKKLLYWYVGKNTLNLLRWSNGYGDTYIKNWYGKEDNDYLTELLDKLMGKNLGDKPLAEIVLDDLKATYLDVVHSQSVAK